MGLDPKEVVAWRVRAPAGFQRGVGDDGAYRYAQRSGGPLGMRQDAIDKGLHALVDTFDRTHSRRRLRGLGYRGTLCPNAFARKVHGDVIGVHGLALSTAPAQLRHQRLGNSQAAATARQRLRELAVEHLSIGGAVLAGAVIAEAGRAHGGQHLLRQQRLELLCRLVQGGVRIPRGLMAQRAQATQIGM